MGIIGGLFGHRILRVLGAQSVSTHSNSADLYYANFEVSVKELEKCFGKDLRARIKDKKVIDFGCGPGYEAVQLAKMGTASIIGIDIQEKLLSHGRKLAEENSVSDRCTFTTNTNQLADVVISKDAFEHFDDPGHILDLMEKLLTPGGHIEISFGPTWLHPYGGHLFSVFPWAHLLFTENALIRWRADFKSDGATKFSEVAGGLNQITIREFEQIVEKSALKIDWLETVPIRGVSLFKHKLFREFGTSIVRCKLVRKT